MAEDATSGNRVSVYQAAEVMGVTVDAIRKRVSRGTISHKRDEHGRVWIILDTDQDPTSNVRDTDRPQSDSAALISQMRERIESLEHQLDRQQEEAAERDRENRRLLLRALERIPPQLEAPESPVTVEEAPEGAGPRSAARGAQEGAHRPWWRRILGSRQGG